MENAGKNAHPNTTLQPQAAGGGRGRVAGTKAWHQSREPTRSASSARRKWGSASLRAASGLPQALLLLIIMIMITFQEH